MSSTVPHLNQLQHLESVDDRKDGNPEKETQEKKRKKKKRTLKTKQPYFPPSTADTSQELDLSYEARLSRLRGFKKADDLFSRYEQWISEHTSEPSDTIEIRSMTLIHELSHSFETWGGDRFIDLSSKRTCPRTKLPATVKRRFDNDASAPGDRKMVANYIYEKGNLPGVFYRFYHSYGKYNTIFNAAKHLLDRIAYQFLDIKHVHLRAVQEVLRPFGVIIRETSKHCFLFCLLGRNNDDAPLPVVEWGVY